MQASAHFLSSVFFCIATLQIKLRAITEPKSAIIENAETMCLRFEPPHMIDISVITDEKLSAVNLPV